MKTIYLSSRSEQKIKACESAFIKGFYGMFSIVGVSTDSGVPNQPHGEDARIDLIMFWNNIQILSL